MNRKFVILTSVGLVVLLLGSVLAISTLAQGPTTTPQMPFAGFGRGCGRGGLMGQNELEAAAKALNMTAAELSTQLWGGRTLADVAEKAGVDLQTVRDAVDAARQEAQAAQKEAFKAQIEQAVADGKLTREQADWLLKGLDLGLLPGGRGGFGHGMMGGRLGGFKGGMMGRFGRFAPAQPESTAPSPSAFFSS